MVSKAIGEALGQLYRNLRNPRWVAAEAGKSAGSIFVVNPLGRHVKAQLQRHLHHEVHIGDVYEDADGNEYLIGHDMKYRYDPRSNSWKAA